MKKNNRLLPDWKDSGGLQQVSRMMKCVLFFMLTLVCGVEGKVYSQQYTLDLHLKQTSLEEVFNRIEAQTGLKFLYNTLLIDSKGKVDVEARQEDIRKVLAELLNPLGLTYILNSNHIVVKQADAAAPQEKTVIKGKVTDSKGSPLPGVTVRIKGTNIGVVSDNDGHYELTLPAGTDPTLIFSFVGMLSQEAKYTGQRELNITLHENISEMEEVVVTGIFTKAKESYTGAVTTITEKELKAAGNHNLLSSIRNLDPSFNIIENLEYGSDPNRLPDVTMRGRTSMDVNVRDLQEDANTQSSANMPLFILDGFEISLQRMMDMDQELVESITLLKDASATALYGSRGANGIVVITSKRPEPGKLRVSYRGTVNIEAPDFSSYNLMNASEKLEYERLANLYHSSYNDTQLKLEQLYNQRKIDVERGVDTYWLKYPVRTGVGSRHSLRIDGGADHFNYAVTLSYNNIAGVMKQSARNTLSGNLFFQYEYKNLKFQNDFTVSYNKNNNSPYGSFSEYATLSPLYTPYNDDGSLKKMLSEETVTTNNPQITGNPLYNATLPSRNDGRYTNLQNNFAMEWNILPELFMRARLGLTKQDDRSDVYLSRDHTSFETDYYTGDNYKLRGSYVYSTAYYFAYEGDITLNYNQTFKDKHQLYAGFSFNFADDKTENYGFTAQGFSALNKDNIGMASTYAVESKPSSSEDHSRRFGSILNLNYTYNHRYFVDFSGKLEGSSKFGSNDRIAPFWSAGIGWNIHNEKFWGNPEWLTQAKIRSSVGYTGNVTFSPYQAQTTYQYSSDNIYLNGVGADIIALGNEDLKWQRKFTVNLGCDLDFWEGRFSLTGEYFREYTKDVLMDISLPPSLGFIDYKENFGEMENKGWSLNLRTQMLRDTERELYWSLAFGTSDSKNKIKKITDKLGAMNDENNKNETKKPVPLYEEGESLDALKAVPSLGIDPETGKEVFVKKDGSLTTIWDYNDKVVCGTTDPKFRGTLNSFLTFKGISLNMSFNFQWGGQTYNQTLASRVEGVNPNSNCDRRVLYDRWKKPGDRTFFKNIALEENVSNLTTRFVQDYNYFQIGSISLGYEMRRELCRKIGLTGLRFNFNMGDIARFSSVKEERGLSYPFARQFTFSLSASL